MLNNKQQQLKNYWILTDIMQIKEITSQKYAEITGISHFTVKKYCREGFLTCRKIKNDGTVVSDYKADKKGTWMVDSAKAIGE